MYLEMINGSDVLIMPKVEKTIDYSKSNKFMLTAIAKSLGAKSVLMAEDDKPVPIDTEKTIIITDDKDIDFLCKAQFYIRWDDCNQAYTLEEIKANGVLVAWFEYKENEGIPSKVMKEEKFNFFDTKFINYDFTVNKFNPKYKNEGTDDIEKIDEGIQDTIIGNENRLFDEILSLKIGKIYKK